MESDGQFLTGLWFDNTHDSSKHTEKNQRKRFKNI